MATQNLQDLTDAEIISRTERLAADERRITIEILHHLAEIQRRRLFASRGWSSLFEYCTGELGYSSSAAQRRIASMRLMGAIPEVEEKIQDGSLNLSNLASAQTFFRNEEKHHAPLSDTEKREILHELEGKSTREAERTLASLSTSPETLKRDRIKPVNSTHSQISFVADQTLLDALAQIRGLLAHQNADLTTAELIAEMARITLAKLNPAKPARQAKPPREVKPTAGAGSASQQKSRYVPAAVEKAVWKRDEGRCTYQDPESGRKCGSQFGLELDHLVPFAQGGQSTVENMALKCRVHNQVHAIESYGFEHMAGYLKNAAKTSSDK